MSKYIYTQTDDLEFQQKDTLTKHQPGRHNQKTHAGGGLSGEWKAGAWHKVTRDEYVAILNNSYRRVQEQVENREISVEEWNRDYQEQIKNIPTDYPDRAYINGPVFIQSWPKESQSIYQTPQNEKLLLEKIDKLYEKYPVKSLAIRISDKRTLRVTEDPKAFGGTARGGSMMWLKGDALFPGKVQTTNQMPIANVIGLNEYILTHEWGHLMDLSSDGNEGAVMRLLNADYGGKTGTSLMSAYGLTDPAEAFAESFAEYAISRSYGAVSSVNPLVNAMGKEFGWDKPWKK